MSQTHRELKSWEIEIICPREIEHVFFPPPPGLFDRFYRMNLGGVHNELSNQAKSLQRIDLPRFQIRYRPL